MNDLHIGASLGDDTDAVTLDARRFNRHTFWCGQSGSGKTYALGVVLEQLLLHTELPLLVFDPNADFVRLPKTRASADSEESARLAGLDIRVLRSGRDADAPLLVRYLELSPAAKAAALGLDPIADAEEYNALVHLEDSASTETAVELAARLRASGDPFHRRLAHRMENLRVLDWRLWSRRTTSVLDVIDERPRATVLDLGGFDEPAEPKVAALAVLEHLWRRREQRRPVMIVIDEAHNLCPPTAETALERALTAQLVQIAAEGRKFGLWLLVSTQRPTKIHPNVLSQCDNLGLLRVNAPRDLAEIGDVFGFVPAELLHRAQQFRQGQALFAGGFVAQPTLTQMGERLTEEGGGDVAVPLRSGS